MKKSMFKSTLLAMALAVVVSPNLVWAESGGAQTQGSGGTTTSEGGSAGTMTVAQSTIALINWLAADSLNRYQHDQRLRYMAAPGTLWAQNAGSVVGANAISPTTGITPLLTSSLQYATVGMNNTFSRMSMRQTDPLTRHREQPPGQMNMVDMYTKLKPYLREGDVASLAPYNPAQMLTSNNLTKSGIQEASQDFVMIMTDPLPRIDPELEISLERSAQTGEELNGANQEKVVGHMIESAILGVSATAWGDIVARRTPLQGQTQSMMEMMDEYASKRIGNTQWLSALNAASTEAILRDLTQIQAFSLWMQFQQLRIQEEQLALSASMNSVMAKLNREMNNLSQQVRASTAQAQVQGSQLQQQIRNSSQQSSISNGESNEGSGGN